LTLLALVAFAVAAMSQLPERGIRHFQPFFPDGESGSFGPLLHATALMFVAYTGYARIATMSEEVVTPSVTIPRAIIITLVTSALLYTIVAIAAIGTIGTDALAGSTTERATPLEAAAARLEVPGLAALLAIGAVSAMLGVLLNLVLGL